MKTSNSIKIVKAMFVFSIALTVVMGVSWGVNIYKLLKCDFQAPYKCEIVHLVGLIPPAAIVTVWLEAGK